MNSFFWSDLPGRLTLGGFLGQGSYGKVYQGTYNSRPVAVKKLHEILLDERISNEDKEGLLADFAHESEISRSVKDPNVVEFIGACIHPDQEGGAVLVMELMDQTLEKYLQDNRGSLPRDKQVDICRQIASGLKYLHSLDPQILHRDLKSSNILLDREGSTAKISDFGQARFRRANQYLSTTNPGTFLYMPPECLRDGDSKFSDKGDVFSLGVLMLEIGTQEPPSCFLGGISDRPEVERRAEDLSRLPDDHPLKFCIVRCISNDTNGRPLAEEVFHHLETRLQMMSQQEYGFSDLVTICQAGLRRKNILFIQAARDFVEHHETAIHYFREATGDVEKGFQRVSVAKIAGNAILIAGDVPAIIGGVFIVANEPGSRLVQLPGMFLLGLAAVLLFVGGVTTIVALIGDVVYNHMVRKQANKWVTDVNTHRDHVIQAHAEYLQLRDQIIEDYDCSNDEVIQTSLAYTFNNLKVDPKFDLPEFMAANPKDRITTREVAKALESGVQIIGISLVWLLCLAGIMPIIPLVNDQIHGQGLETFYWPLVILGSLSSIFAAIFAVVILVFICKTGYSIYRSDKGTQLSRKLRATAEALELEAEELRPFAMFVVRHTCTPATCKELRNRIDQHMQAIHTLAHRWDAGVEYFLIKAINVRKTVACFDILKLVCIAIASLADIVVFIVGILLLSDSDRITSVDFLRNPGVVLIILCVSLECFGSFVALCAIIADVVTRSKTLKHGNSWIDNSIMLRSELVERHEGLCEELNSMKQSIVNEDTFQAVFGFNYKRPDSVTRELLQTGHTARITIKWRWWKVLEFGIQTVTFLFAGPFICFIWIPLEATYLAVTSIILGALFVLINIPIFIKTIRDLSTMELHRKLQDVARGLARELEVLRTLARLAGDM